jgi:hypothetical protein|tara:strand:- start:561 stop:746 length:186 start_codon:yes stop_codon:yes gene_type:complete
MPNKLKNGDLVKTKIPGFGTGKESRFGIVIDASVGSTADQVDVFGDDGKMRTWYEWQLERS